jgi:hypothetical protein
MGGLSKFIDKIETPLVKHLEKKFENLFKIDEAM